MKIVKNIKDGKFYTMVELKPGIFTAVPIRHSGESISNCNMSDFIPVPDTSIYPLNR